MADPPPYGVLAEFDDPAALLAAARAVRGAGVAGLDAFTPFPVEGLAEALGGRRPRTRWVALAGGLLGGAAGWAMQAGANLAYRIPVGGRPLMPAQAFGFIAFEFVVMGAVAAMVAALFLRCRLPRLNHPLFGVDTFEQASVNGFFLFVAVRDTPNDRRAAAAVLLAQDPRAIVEVP